MRDSVRAAPQQLCNRPCGFTGDRSRIIVTMGMPALFYRWFFRAHSLKSLERNILKFVGIRPVRTTLFELFGLVEGVSAGRREQWLGQAHTLGTRGFRQLAEINVSIRPTLTAHSRPCWARLKQSGARRSGSSHVNFYVRASSCR